ncbi:MAG: OsmC family protein [Ktedonobacterales bacterium]
MAERHHEHTYLVSVTWTGNRGQGTSSYTSYDRNHEISGSGKPSISASSDPAFRGDRSRYNPEELLVAALSSCHMLWYLHLCSQAHLVVTEYTDDATGTMVETDDGGGHFSSVTLRPRVTLAPGSDLAQATSLHEQAHHLCFIANSVNFPIGCEPAVEMGQD